MKKKLSKKILIYLLLLIIIKIFPLTANINISLANSANDRLFYYEKYEGYYWDYQPSDTYLGQSTYLYKNTYDIEGGWHSGGLAKKVGGKSYAIMYSDYEIVPVKYGRFTSYEIKLTGEQVLVPEGRFSGVYFIGGGGTSGNSVFIRGTVKEFYYNSIRGYSFRTNHYSTQLILERGRRIYKNRGKGEFIETIIALDGQFPDDGYHNGYYYVKKEPVIYEPTISLEQPANNIYVGLNEEITISGTITDKNPNEYLTVYYTIEGVPEHTNKRLGEPIISNGDSQSFTSTILVDDTIPEGKINLKVWVEDDSSVLGSEYSNQKSNTVSKTINIVKTLSLINKLIERNIINENKPQIIIANTNNEIQNIPYNDNIIHKLKYNLNNIDGNLYFIGKDGETEHYITQKLTENYYNYKDVYNILSFVKSIQNEIKVSNTFIVGEYIEHIFDFDDLEKDYSGITITDKLKNNNDIPKLLKSPKTLLAKYTHKPDVFDNPVNKHSKDNGIWNKIDSINDSYIINKADSSMRGEWILEVRASDDTGNPLYDKYSDVKSYNFVIHSKPVAIIEHYKQETDTELYLTAMNSYDIDYQYSKPYNGIKSYVWQYQLEDGSWHIYSQEKNIVLPKEISGQRVTNYSLTVEDYHGALDTSLSSIEEPDEIIVNPLIEAELHSELPEFDTNPIIIPSTERLKVTNIITQNIEPIQNVKFALFDNNGNRRTNYVTLYNPGDIVNGDIIETYWRDIRDYQIPSRDINNNYLRDGNYKARLIATDGVDSLSKEWDIEIKTPVNLQPLMPKKIKTDTTTTIKAETSKYVETLAVTLYKGESFEKTLNMTVDRISANKKEWIVNYDVPIELPQGTYTAEFTARTANGNVEIDSETFILESLDLTDLRITHIYNHPNYEDKYPILYNDPMVPVEYKTGYYITFKINAVGSPESVKMKISYPGYDKEFEMIKESENGNDSVWKLEWYADSFTPFGTIINTEVIAQKGETILNFNNKYNWDGDFLRITGTIEQDWRVDQEF